MGKYKVVDAAQLDADLESLADSIRAKAGVADKLAFPAGMKAAVDGILVEPPPKDVNFYDYDGRRLYSYSAEELMELTALPEPPSHDGLICQGWNWSLDALKALNRRMEVGAVYITDDGKTRVYISLQEGRTSPVLGCYVNGTVTVDWGDGTSPDVLTGTDITAVQWTPCHDYAEAGDYVISLTVDGEMAIYGDAGSDDYCRLLRYSSAADPRNRIYNASIKKIEIGAGVTSIGSCAFYYCYSMKSVTIPEGITSIGERAFYYCNNLSAVILPDGTVSTGGYLCYYGAALKVFSMPDGFAELGGSSFYNCYSLKRFTLPDNVQTIGGSAFYNCYTLSELGLNEGITEIPKSCLSGCQSLAYLKVPKTVLNIAASAFSGNRGTKCYDFSDHTAVPTLENTSAFANNAADCEFRVPAALAEEWKAASVWSSYAEKIVGTET